MNFSFSSLFEIFVLVIALSIDAFIASFGYGTNKIKIPLMSVGVIAAICSGFLALSLLAGSVISLYLPKFLTSLLCFGILFILGLFKLFESSVKVFIRRQKNEEKKLKFTIFHLKCILSIYADPKKADADSSRVLSPAESASLAVALSLDGIAVGVGAGILGTSVLGALLCSFFFTIVLVCLGCYLGCKIAEHSTKDFSWLSGLLLMMLAFLKLG